MKRMIANILYRLSVWLDRIAGMLQKIVILSGSSKRILIRNKIFENKHKGQRAFVIVNGPSLKEQNIEKLKDELTFVVSGFFKHPVIDKWQPSYYSILDKTFFEPTKKSAIFFKDLNEKIKDSTFFIPLYRGYKANKERKILQTENVYYIAMAGLPDLNNDLTTVVQAFESVSVFSLSQAIYMGCSPIYLIGFDHDYLAHRGIDRHFYEGGTLEGHISSHTPMSEMNTYDSEMMSNYKHWQNYRSLKNIASQKGIKIINATDGGFLDLFERVQYNSIFEKN